ncbi:MAG: hypothetical protein JWO78_1023 [Micavibrio sp.]|nr:hypothetical protein [Micavibrio sp.]
MPGVSFLETPPLHVKGLIMILFLHSIQKPILLAGAFLLMIGTARADVLQGLSSALNNTLNQSVQNTQSGVANGVQSTIRSNTPHANEVNAAKNVASNTTTTFSARTLCSQIPAELQNKYTHVCASFDANNPCSALPIAGNLSKEQAHLRSLCNAQQSLSNLQGQTATRVTPSSGRVGTAVNQQMQNQLNALIQKR